MDPIINQIKERSDIVEIISGYLSVKKSGTNFRAVCPFHNEKTPSLMISPQKQIWHCFGCGEGGDVFGFIMRQENLDFKETLKLLAQKTGVVLPEYKPGDNAKAELAKSLIRVNKFAANYFCKLLQTRPKNHPAATYLAKRGLSEQTIIQWNIGLAPNDFHSLQQALETKNVPINLMIEAGVVIKGDKGVYDRFRNRITFPICNYYGETVGFSARALPEEDSQAKYINSPETAVYHKSSVLFGLDKAKEAIRKQDEVVVVEGQMDCIQAHQAGFSNTVASSGTALTEDHLRLLGRLTKKIKFCFDADNAGSAATRRGGELALSQGYQVKIIKLDKAKDPDELIKHSPGLWQKAVAEALWFTDYYIERAIENFESNSIEQKHYLSKEVIPLLSFLSDPLEYDHYVYRLGQKFGLSEKSIRQSSKTKATLETAPTVRKTGSADNDPSSALAKEILGGILADPEFKAFVSAQGLDTARISGPAAPLIARILQTGIDENLLEDTVAKEALFMLESQQDQLDENRPAWLSQLKKGFFLLKLHTIKQEQAELTYSIRLAEQAGDHQRTQALNRRFAELSRVRLEIEQQL